MQGIPGPLIERFWPFAEPYIKRALDHASGEFTPDDFKQKCANREMQLWLITKETKVAGAVTTELVIYPRRKHCRIITLAGTDFAGWIDLANSTLDAWGKEQGCDAMECYVRKGLVPRLAPLGYKHRHSVILKELHKEN
jgi:hypothetical protein